jgi:hypothetical protein
MVIDWARVIVSSTPLRATTVRKWVNAVPRVTSWIFILYNPKLMKTQRGDSNFAFRAANGRRSVREPPQYGGEYQATRLIAQVP